MDNKIFSCDYKEKAFKIISIITFSFLILNFIFNMGYFLPLGLKFFSMLSIRDYYEGTAPLLIFSIMLYGSVFNIPVFHRIVQDLPKNIKILYEVKMKLPNDLKKLKKDIEKSNITEEECKIFQDRYKNTEKEIKEFTESQELKDFNKYGFDLFVFAVLLPIIIIFFNSVFISKNLLLVLLLVFIAIISSFFIPKDSVRKPVLVIFTISFLMLLGLRQFICDYNDLNVLGIFQNNKYYIIRPISKGYIVKDKDNNIKFIDLNQTVTIDNKTNSQIIDIFLKKQKNENFFNRIFKIFTWRNKLNLINDNEVSNISYIKLENNKIIEVKILIKELSGDINE